MMLAEIVPAFRGIATKLAPGSVPAMDIPLIFPYTKCITAWILNSSSSKYYFNLCTGGLWFDFGCINSVNGSLLF